MSNSDSEEFSGVGRAVAGPAAGFIVGGLTGNHYLGHAASSAASEIVKRNPKAAGAIGTGAVLAGAGVAAGTASFVITTVITALPPVAIGVALLAAGGWMIKKLNEPSP